MRFFVDSANPVAVGEILAMGVASGVTTNPNHLAEIAEWSRLGTIRRLLDVIRRSGTSLPLSVQVMTTEPAQMVEQAEMLRETLQYDGLVIKIPVGPTTLAIISTLAARGFAVNCTACMTQTQALLAVAAGARYVSMFWGKMGDVGIDSLREVRYLAESLARLRSSSEIIVGSIRTPYDVEQIARSGAHVVTLLPSWFANLASHPQTDVAVASFAKRFVDWGAVDD